MWKGIRHFSQFLLDIRASGLVFMVWRDVSCRCSHIMKTSNWYCLLFHWLAWNDQLYHFESCFCNKTVLYDVCYLLAMGTMSFENQGFANVITSVQIVKQLTAKRRSESRSYSNSAQETKVTYVHTDSIL